MDDSSSVSLTSCRRRGRRDDCPLDVRLRDGAAVAAAAAAEVRLAAGRGDEGAVRRVQLLAVGRNPRLLVLLLLLGELKLKHAFDQKKEVTISSASSYPCTRREVTQPHQSPKPLKPKCLEGSNAMCGRGRV